MSRLRRSATALTTAVCSAAAPRQVPHRPRPAHRYRRRLPDQHAEEHGLIRTRISTLARTASALAASILTALGVLLTCAPTAQATGYRYWSFWQWDHGRWSYAQQGPAAHRPDDGDAQGWRFAVSQDSAARAARPRPSADFDDICADTPAKSGTKRIALVIDFGSHTDAPDGERPPRPDRRSTCARVPEDASSADALAAGIKPLRYDSNALLCAIAGYPKAGCGATVPSRSKASHDGEDGTDATDRKDATDRNHAAGGSSLSLGLLAGGAAVAVLAAAALWQARRHRT